MINTAFYNHSDVSHVDHRAARHDAARRDYAAGRKPRRGVQIRRVRQPRGKRNAGFLNETTYTGSVTDKSTGLQYMNARYYDAENGRFLTQDTYTGNPYDPWTQHLYAYCGNNPTSMVDLTGHWFWEAGWNKKKTTNSGGWGGTGGSGWSSTGSSGWAGSGSSGWAGSGSSGWAGSGSSGWGGTGGGGRKSGGSSGGGSWWSKGGGGGNSSGTKTTAATQGKDTGSAGTGNKNLPDYSVELNGVINKCCNEFAPTWMYNIPILGIGVKLYNTGVYLHGIFNDIGIILAINGGRTQKNMVRAIYLINYKS